MEMVNLTQDRVSYSFPNLDEEAQGIFRMLIINLKLAKGYIMI